MAAQPEPPARRTTQAVKRLVGSPERLRMPADRARVAVL